MLERWLRMRKEGYKDLSSGTSTGRKRYILPALDEKEALRGQLEENDESTTVECRHCQMWKEKTTGIAVSVLTMGRALLEKLACAYKKVGGCRRARRRS